MSDIGILYPEMPVALGPTVPFAEIARRRGHRLWFGHSSLVDSQATMAALIGRGYTIPYGSAVALFPLWHSHQFAVQARSIANLSGNTYIAGIGPGGKDFQTNALGAPLARPVTASGEFVVGMKRALYPDSGADLLRLKPRADQMLGSVETGLGVLRPAMARCAGRTAEWAVTWLTPGAYLKELIIPAMAESAEEHGRSLPHVASVVHFAVRRSGRDPFALAHTAAHAHLRGEHYASMLRQAGLDVETGSTERGAAELVRSGTFLYGDTTEIAEGIDQLQYQGVGEVILNSYGVATAHGVGAALDDLEEVLEATDYSKRPVAASLAVAS